MNEIDIRITRRKEELVKELSRKLLPLRHDSRLCSSYVYGQLGDEWDLSRVVNECCTMHWLYTYTAYPLKMREAYMYFSTILTSGKSVHEFIKHNVQPHIKGQIIFTHGGIPSTWPWLQLPLQRVNPEVKPEENPEVKPEENPEETLSETSSWETLPELTTS